MTRRSAILDGSRKHQRAFMFVVCALAAVGLQSATTSAAVEQAGKLNILLLTVDDMNWDSIGVFGCPVDDITPNIDRLASEGVRFENAHVTVAICQPTRAVWMLSLIHI